ncbi:MAG: DUF4384 domain-containing protein [Treponema sp.]|nr:DUF4384 domain-containing protein [Treponema sp.]
MKKAITAFLFLSFSVCLYAQTLSWDISFLRGRTQESAPISQIIRMQTGETFEFSITPNASAFCYIVFYDSQRKVFVLHNEPLAANAEKIFGPFQLEAPAGTETIYVIMSLQRQANLERLIQAYNNNTSATAQANSLYREVVNLQNSVSRLGEPVSSYIPSGGTTRSAVPRQVTRFSGKDLYVRAISIRH